MFNCHRADILSIAVNAAETQVYAAGIDPVLIQFELSPVTASNDWMVWQRGTVRAHHTHDVRAVVMMGNLVISGGAFVLYTCHMCITNMLHNQYSCVVYALYDALPSVIIVLFMHYMMHYMCVSNVLRVY